ncbi:thrombospondin type 3 repeat-containing protein [bacterium]|nr:thrombospondin type 3 repeat-containing protein [bacterium]
MKNVLRSLKLKGVVAVIFLIFATLHATESSNYYSVRAYNASPEAVQFLQSNMEKIYYDRYGMPTYIVKLENLSVLSQYSGIEVNFGVTSSEYNSIDLNETVPSKYSWDFGNTVDTSRSGWKTKDSTGNDWPEHDWPSYPAMTVELLNNVNDYVTQQLPVEDIERVVRSNIASALYFIEYNIAAESVYNSRWDREDFNPSLVDIDADNDHCVDYFPNDCLSAKNKDSDNDGVVDELDNCPNTKNPGQTDFDKDGTGDLCDPCPRRFGSATGLDSDGDGIDDGCDNCPLHYNKLEPINPFSEIISAPISKFFKITDENNEPLNKGLELYYEGGAFYSGGYIYYAFSDIKEEDLGYFFTEEEIEFYNSNPNIFGDKFLLSTPIYPFNGVPVTYSTEIDLFNGRSALFFSFNYLWQPDHDLDGIGDVCDMPGEVVRERIPTIDDAGKLVLDSDDKALFVPQIGDGFAYNKIKTVKNLTTRKAYLPWIGGYDDTAVKIELQMPLYSKDPQSCVTRFSYQINDNLTLDDNVCQSAVHFCAVDKRLKHLWGEDGYCSTSDKTERYNDNSNLAKPLFPFGFSHGSDDFSESSVYSWRMRISSAKTGNSLKNMGFETEYLSNPNSDVYRSIQQTSTTGESVYWNWRRDWWYWNECYRPDKTDDPRCLALKTPPELRDSENTMYYAISTNIVPVTKAQASAGDVPSYNNEATSINNNYFFNSKEDRFSGSDFWKKDASKYGRAHRYSMNKMELNYHGKVYSTPDPEIDPPIDLSKFQMELCIDCWWRIPLTILDDEMMKYQLGRWSLEKRIDNVLHFFAEPLSIPENAMLFMSAPDSGELFSVVQHSGQNEATSYTLEMSPKDGGIDWQIMGALASFPESLKITAVTPHRGRIYILGHTPDASEETLFAITPETIPPEGITLPNSQDRPQFVVSNVSVTGISEDSFDEIQIISSGEKLFLVGSDATGGETKTFKLNTETTLFEEVAGQSPAYRKIYNLKKSSGYIFLIGGMNTNNDALNDMWRFNTETEIWEQLLLTLQGDFRKVIIQEVEGKLIAANPIMDGNTTHPAFTFDPTIQNINNIVIEYVEIPVTETKYMSDENYCFLQRDSSLFGGLLFGNSCIPFTTRNHAFYQMNGLVNDVAGYNNYLYTSLDNAVTVLDISNPSNIAEVLSIPTDFVVHDIDIKNDTAFVTVNNGIASYDISDVNNIVLQDFLITYNTANFVYSSTGPVTDSYGNPVLSSGELGDTTELVIEGNLLYAADGHGITVVNISDPSNLTVVNNVYTSGNTETLALTDDKIYAYDRYSLKIYDKATLNQVYADYLDEDDFGFTEDEPCENAHFTSYNGVVYADCFLSSSVYTIEQNSYLYEFHPMSGDSVELGDTYISGQYGYFADGTGVRVSYFDPTAPVCGDGVVEGDEVCDNNIVACTTLSGDYIGGDAPCNSTCNGYNESGCEDDDGW